MSDHSPDPQIAKQWRRAVLDLVGDERRHRFPALLHVGLPGQVHRTVLAGRCRYADRKEPDLLPDEDRPQDSAHRCDIVAALLASHLHERGSPPLVWVTRPGELTLHDVDAAWLGPAARAFAEAGMSAPVAVVTRSGWWDPRSGVRRTWKRPRDRS